MQRAHRERGTADRAPWSGEGQCCLGGFLVEETPSLT